MKDDLINHKIETLVFHSNAELDSAPDYCNDISLTKRLLEYMELNNHTFNIYGPDEHSPLMPRYTYTVEFINLFNNSVYSADDFKMEKAICLSALLALGCLDENELR